MAEPGDRRERQACPCLFSDGAPLCRADLKYLHVPPRAHLARYCRQPRYRQCPLYRTWLETLRKAPNGNGDAAVSSANGGTRLATRVDNGRAARKEDLMLRVLRRLLSDERAQDLAEYGVALSVVAAGVFAVAVALRDNVGTLWTLADNIIAAG